MKHSLPRNMRERRMGKRKLTMFARNPAYINNYFRLFQTHAISDQCLKNLLQFWTLLFIILKKTGNAGFFYKIPVTGFTNASMIV